MYVCMYIRMYIQHRQPEVTVVHKADIMHAVVPHLGVGEHGGQTFLKTGQLLILQASKHKGLVLHAQHGHKHHLQDIVHIQSISTL